jgi:hypothetical protein
MCYGWLWPSNRPAQLASRFRQHCDPFAGRPVFRLMPASMDGIPIERGARLGAPRFKYVEWLAFRRSGRQLDTYDRWCSVVRKRYTSPIPPDPSNRTTV